MLKILRKTIYKKADHCNKELETRRKPKLDNCWDKNQAKGNKQQTKST